MSVVVMGAPGSGVRAATRALGGEPGGRLGALCRQALGLGPGELPSGCFVGGDPGEAFREGALAWWGSAPPAAGDPLVSLCLPAWGAAGQGGGYLQLLRGPAAAIEAVRRERGLSHAAAAALWELHVRAAAAALRDFAPGHFTVQVEDLRAGVPAGLEDFLRDAGLVGEAALEGLRGFARGLGEAPPWDLGEVLTPAQAALWEQVRGGSPEVSPELSLGARSALADALAARRREGVVARRAALAAGRGLAVETNALKALAAAGRRAAKLGHLLEDGEAARAGLYRSGRWKLGNALAMRFGRRAAGYPPLDDFLARFRRWREHEDSLPGRVDLEKSGHAAMGAELRRPAPVVEVVVCVHDAPEDVARCLGALAENSGAGLRRIILVDDGSGEETVGVLDAFAARCPYPLRRLRSAEASGYTAAANRGLAVSAGDYVVLLNSDAEVPPGWVERVLACGESDAGIGVVGAVSNAASWQSVPARREGGGDWLVNALPEGLEPGDFALRYALAREPSYPRLPLLNGFFLAIKREVIRRVGVFDEEAFPQGYGEENDYCFRVRRAGFELALADDLYVWHGKSKSYSHARRAELSEAAGKVLHGRYGGELAAAQETLEGQGDLRDARAAAEGLLGGGAGEGMSCLFLLPFRGTGGGTHSVVQEAEGLRQMGVAVQLGIRRRDLEFYRGRYPGVSGQLFHPCLGGDGLLAHAVHFDVVVATACETVAVLRDVVALNPGVLVAYYIQDYEPRFYPAGSPERRVALASYRLVPGMLRFAKTDWLREQVTAGHGVEVAKVLPSLDHTVYRPGDARVGGGGGLRVCAMVRPDSPHRSPELTWDLLQALAVEFGDGIELLAFGCDPGDPFFEGREAGAVDLRGLLPREGVAELLASCDLFLDLSEYQAFGRTGLEAMACGCAVVLPQVGGVGEYAVDGENALLVDTSDAAAVEGAVVCLLRDAGRLGALRAGGLRTAGRFSVAAAAASLESLFSEALRGRRA